MRYPTITFSTCRGQVHDFGVTSEGATTRGGVAIGDDLDAAKDAYPKLRCGVANEGTEYEEYPYCTGRVAPQRFIWFGDDPIQTITLGARRIP